MSYVLDGIRTAMVWAEDVVPPTLRCPCGWAGAALAQWSGRYSNQDPLALRFHYEHCRQARGFAPADELSLASAPSPDSQEPSKATEA
jgi:hypothetical protein